MTRARISEIAKRRYRTAVRDIVNNLSRPVIVYGQPDKHECFNCYFDKLTSKSTGRCKWSAVQAIAKQQEWESLGNTDIRYKYFVQGRCPICKGQGYLTTENKTYVDCLINWNPTGDDITWTSAGGEGSTLVSLKTDPKYLDIFKESSRISIDGVNCKLSRTPIARGLGDPHILLIVAFTTDKLKLDSGEVLKDYT